MNYNWEPLFHELSLKEKIKLITSGLRRPKDSGEYKEARYQLLRLASPLSAITAPVLMMIIITFLAAMECLKPEPTVSVQYLKEEKVEEKLQEIKKEEPKTETQPHKEIIDTISRVEGPTESDPSPVVNELNTDQLPSLQTTRSPLLFRQPPGKGPKTIGEGLQDGGGSAETERAVLQALRWLQYVQEEDGSWKQESGGGPGTGTAPAMTGLALLTFLAHGDTPASKEFGETVEKAIKWLIVNQEQDGRFKGRDNHDYSHPIAAYALCEAFAATKIPMVRDAAEKAVEIIIKGQNQSGGWDYNCKPGNRNDTSYMGWCIQALLAAYKANMRNNGLITAIQKSADGLRQNSDLNGGFGYTGPNPSNLTGVGVLCLQLMEKNSDPLVKQGITWLERATVEWNKPWGQNPLYYWYYVTQAKFHASPETWAKWNPLFSTTLVNNQTVMEEKNPSGRDMGYWKACAETEHCKSYVYNTTLCTLMLEVYYRHLFTYKLETEINDDPNAISKGDVIIDIKLDNA